MSISRQFALNGITAHHSTRDGSAESLARATRHAAENVVVAAAEKTKSGATKQATKESIAADLQAAKKTKMNEMKNRIYTSQISYPSGNGGASAHPGGRLFNGLSSAGNATKGNNATMERERVRTEFYATYDVMTGIRIAATLGGFFTFVILLVMFKSRSHTNQALKDPKIVAVAAAVVLEEEERELQEKLDATGLSLYADDINYEYRRQRLLSLGGFDPALIDSPRRYSYGYASVRRHSKYSSSNASGRGSRRSSELPTISRYSYDYRDHHQRGSGENRGSRCGADDDEFIVVEQDEQLELENEFQEIEFRSHPQVIPRANSYDSRRCSSITCCSTESSYLERRCSALTLGIYSIGASLMQPPPTPSSCQQHQPEAPEELFPYSVSEFTMPVPNNRQAPTQQYPPSATTLSNRALRSNSVRRFGRSSRRSSLLRRNQNRDDATDVSLTLTVDSEATPTSVTLRGTAPLASLSSFKISSMDQPEPDLRSLGSDSVFCEQYVDTDEEVAQFSSDSEEVVVGLPGEDAEEKNVFVENPIRGDIEDRDIPLADVAQKDEEGLCSTPGEGGSCQQPSNVLPERSDSAEGNRKDIVTVAVATRTKTTPEDEAMTPEGDTEMDTIGSSR